MRKYNVLFFSAVIFFVLTSTTFGMNVQIKDTDVKAIETHQWFVRYAWKVTAFSHEHEIYDCMVRISMRDRQGYEVAQTFGYVTVRYGTLNFSGTSRCSPEQWKNVANIVTEMKCR